jgi:hypothetical protein
MSLTDTLCHPWLGSSASSGGDAALPSATTRDGIDRGLSDVSELSEFPEDGLNSANGDAWMFSAVPSSDDMSGVYDLNINSPPQPRARRPLERRSKVLARELAVEAEAEAEAQTAADAEPAATGATPPAVNRKISSRMMARRLRLFGMVEVAGMARDGWCARGAPALWAVRAANRVVDQ